MNSTHSAVAQFAAEYRATSPCSFAPRVTDVVSGTVHRFGPGTRKDYELAMCAFDHAVEAGEVFEVDGRVYVA